MNLFNGKKSVAILDAESRASEILFGLIMALTFTGSLSIADAGRDDVRAVLIGALGCNLAWGIIDGIFYLMGRISDRNENMKAWLAVRDSRNADEAMAAVAAALPPLVASVLSKEELQGIHRRVLALPPPPPQVRPSGREVLGALIVAVLVFVTTFPVAIPFMFIDQLELAMRVSNGIAILMLFVTGYFYGGIVPHRPLLSALAMVLLGAVLVAMTIALGG